MALVDEIDGLLESGSRVRIPSGPAFCLLFNVSARGHDSVLRLRGLILTTLLEKCLTRQVFTTLFGWLVSNQGPGVLGSMGRKHRENRKAVKARLRLMGWRENEYGELIKKRSKAEARRQLLSLKIILVGAEKDVVDSVCKKAREGLCAIEDALVFSQISENTHMESSYAP